MNRRRSWILGFLLGIFLLGGLVLLGDERSLQTVWQSQSTSATVATSTTIAKQTETATFVTHTPNLTNDGVPAPVADDASAKPTIVCQLSGEMANNLGKLAHCQALQWWLQDTYQIDAQIVLRHQEIPKWIRARAAVQQCFPSTTSLNFTAGNVGDHYAQWTQEQKAYFQRLTQQQQARLPEEPVIDYAAILGQVNQRANQTKVTEALHLFAQLITQSNNDDLPPTTSIRIPFLPANYIVGVDLFVDRYYDRMRQFLAFDVSTASDCCKIKPDPDESVFHFRNFLKEMPLRGKRLGFEEAGPNATASELFGHLQPGEKVAIVTRFGTSSAQEYVDVLEHRGLQVRVIANQTGVQDFCFLMNAQKEMVGAILSSYFRWAAILSNCTRIVAYSIDSKAKRQATKQLHVYYNWTHPEPRSRFEFPLTHVDEDMRRRLRQQRLWV